MVEGHGELAEEGVLWDGGSQGYAAEAQATAITVLCPPSPPLPGTPHLGDLGQGLHAVSMAGVCSWPPTPTSVLRRKTPESQGGGGDGGS